MVTAGVHRSGTDDHIGRALDVLSFANRQSGLAAFEKEVAAIRARMQIKRSGRAG